MNKLIRIIEAHGHHAIEQEGELMVLSHSYSAAEGKSYFEWERIEATVRAAKDWLGY